MASGRLVVSIARKPRIPTSKRGVIKLIAIPLSHKAKPTPRCAEFAR
jgi:hypothetical protein